MIRSWTLTVALACVLVLTGCSGDGGSIVPTATIAVDGSIDDWPSNKPTVGDPSGDQQASTPGGDIVAIFLAQNADNIYIRIDVSNGPISDRMEYMLAFNRSRDWDYNVQFIQMNISDNSCVLHQGTSGEPIRLAAGRYAVNGNTIEMSVPRDAFNTTSTRYLTGSSGTAAYNFIDHAPEDGTPIDF